MCWDEDTATWLTATAANRRVFKAAMLYKLVEAAVFAERVDYFGTVVAKTQLNVENSAA